MTANAADGAGRACIVTGVAMAMDGDGGGQ